MVSKKKVVAKRIMENYGREVEAFDRFSNLPDLIIHHIMSFLPPNDSTRVSFLSKKLGSVYRSYPILDFDQRLYDNGLSRSKEKLKAPLSLVLRFMQKSLKCMYDKGLSQGSPLLFLDFMQKSLERVESNLCIDKFKLCIEDNNEVESDKRIAKSIKFAIEHNVKELVLKFGEVWRYHPFYSLPKSITLKSIVVLKLQGFDFKFEDLIPNLTLVEDLTLKDCMVSSNFTISSAKLKTLKLGHCRGLENIAIDAFNLQSFRTSSFGEPLKNIVMDAFNLQSLEMRLNSSCEINLVHCKSLKNLILHNATITDDWIENLVSELLLLENLTLSSCGFLKEIKICNQHLKCFHLISCIKLVKAEIEAPNLISFVYSGYLSTFFPEINFLSSSPTHAKLYLSAYFHTTEWFMNLKNFLVVFGHCKMLWLISPDQVFRL